MTQERIAENDSRFRDANERIYEVATEYAVEIAIPFLCECADPRCMEVVRLEPDEYWRLRTNPRWFLNVSGHESVEGAAARVVSTHDGWVVAEKMGHAGRVAEELAGGQDGLSEEEER